MGEREMHQELEAAFLQLHHTSRRVISTNDMLYLQHLST